jgi:xanthine dehydrogenase accessory factor
VKDQTLSELNTERAARRAVIVITDVAHGDQRLIKAADIAADQLQADLDRQ